MRLPKSEIFNAVFSFLYAGLFTLGVFLSMSLYSGVNAQVYEGRDEYRNLIFTLTLNADLSYTIEEKFLDGSVWVDSGSWVKSKDELSLISFKKTQRKHYYLKYKKTLKFKGDTFRMADEKLYYLKKGNYKLNGHYSALVIRKLPAYASPVDSMVE